MDAGVQRAARMVAVLSPAYLERSPFGEAEWRPAFAKDPSGQGRAEDLLRPCRKGRSPARAPPVLQRDVPNPLGRFDTHRISNGRTEAVNLIIDKTHRLAHGFRTFER